MAGVFGRQVEGRSGAKVSISPETLTEDDGTLSLELTHDGSLTPESFAITHGGRHRVQVHAADQLGLLYGLGKFLRDARYPVDGFALGRWEGQSTPAKPVRGMYLATHFHNYYHDAPVPEIQHYLEGLALGLTC